MENHDILTELIVYKITGLTPKQCADFTIKKGRYIYLALTPSCSQAYIEKHKITRNVTYDGIVYLYGKYGLICKASQLGLWSKDRRFTCEIFCAFDQEEVEIALLECDNKVQISYDS